MKKFWCVLVTLLLLCGNALAAGMYSFPAYDMEMECADDYVICITRDTKSVDEFQIEGTPFDKKGMKEALEQTVEKFQGPDSPDTIAGLIVYHNNNFYLIETHVYETDVSKEIWDISVMTEQDKQAIEASGKFSIYEAVSEKQSNLWLLGVEEGMCIYGMTFNNGKMIAYTFFPQGKMELEDNEAFVKEFLNGVWFTEKRTKGA